MTRSVGVFNMLMRETVSFGRDARPVDGCRLIRVAHEHWGPLTDVRREDFGVHSLSVVVSGSGRFSDGSRWWDLRPGSVFFFGPGLPHTVACGPEQGMIIYIHDFDGPSAERMVLDAVGSTCAAAIPADARVVVSGAAHLFEVARTGRPSADRTAALLLRALLETIGAGLQTGAAPGSVAERSFLACREYIDSHHVDMVSTAPAARAAHVSHAYLCRLFRRFAGTTPQGYLARLKADHAAHLLMTTPLTVKEISARLGFADQYAFSKCFKRVMGMAPTHFRGRGSGGAADREDEHAEAAR